VSRRDRAALVVFVGVAFGLRVWWSGAFSSHPALSDPDGYAGMSRALVGPYGWHWTRRAVQFAEFTKAPLYQILLSFVWRVSGAALFVPSVLVLHALLNAFTPVALYVTATRLHNARAGLIAAALSAVWTPNILPTGTLWQEQLFIPAVCWAMGFTATAVATRIRRDWFLAGCAFGVAALTRSSITYFVLPASAVVALSARPRRQAIEEAALILAGFAVLVVPYVFYISSVTGHLTFIENVGYFSLKRIDSVSAADPRINLLTIMHDPSGPPTTGEALTFLWRDFHASPGAFVERRLSFIRLLLKPAGAALLPNLFVPTAGAAAALRVLVHACVDLPFAAALVLAPLGVVLARCRRLALVLALWPPIYLGLVALILWAGTRYRAPAEPVLLTLAAVVAASGWKRPARTSLAIGAAVSVVLLLLLTPSVPSMVAARANYGVEEEPVSGSDVAFGGAMGAYVTCHRNALVFSLRSTSTGDASVEVRVDGKEADAFTFHGTVQRRYPLDAPKRLYLEVAAVSGGSPAPLAIRLD
jgi:hypothetical protein